jgi:ribosomal protein L7Ae-like RNA K-turn-binding protein
MTKEEQGIYSFLGLCMKAGKVTSGETGTLQNIQSGKAKLVIVSLDASDNTRKEMLNKCKSHNVTVQVFGQKDLLGLSIGKSERSSLAITDQGLAEALLQKLQTIEQNGGETNVKD